MKKNLYLRLFARVDDIIAVDAIKLSATNKATDMDIADSVNDQKDVVGDWMSKHPQGKVDFVWL